MVLHSDFPAIPLRGVVQQVRDRTFQYHPKKADGTRDESRLETVSRRVAYVLYDAVGGGSMTAVLVPVRDWQDCDLNGLGGKTVDFAITELQEDRNTMLPLFRFSGFEVCRSPAK